MKYLSIILLLAVFASSGDAVTKTIPRAGDKTVSSVSGTFANSQVDTVKLTYEAGITGIGFGIYFADSTSVTTAILRRVVNGVAQAVIAGDTLLSSYALTAAGSKTTTVTLAPLAEAYWVIVTYAGSANGVTSPTLRYYQVTQHP